MISISRLARIAILLCAPALYASPVAAQDPVISEISKNGYNVIRHLNSRPGDELTAGDAEKVKKAIMANKFVDAGEAKLLEYLQAEQSFIIKSRGSGYVDLTFNKSVSDEAKAILSLISSASFDDPVEQKWARGNKADLKQLLDLYNGSPQGREKVLGVLVTTLEVAWKSDDYKQRELAMKAEMARWSAKLSTLSGSNYGDFKKVLFQAAVIADRRESLSHSNEDTGPPFKFVDGGITNRLYEFLEN